MGTSLHTDARARTHARANSAPPCPRGGPSASLSLAASLSLSSPSLTDRHRQTQTQKHTHAHRDHAGVAQLDDGLDQALQLHNQLAPPPRLLPRLLRLHTQAHTHTQTQNRSAFCSFLGPHINSWPRLPPRASSAGAARKERPARCRRAQCTRLHKGVKGV